MEKVGEERNLTFFECLSRTLKSHQWNGREIHDQLLLHMANVCFAGAEECYQHFSELIDDIRCALTEHLVLRPECVENLAVQQWVRRFHHSTPCVSDDARQWLTEYPVLLKTAIIRFLWYHRKPHRLYCKYTFALLAVEYYHCTLGIEEGTDCNWKTRWFYPLDSDQYFIETSDTVVMRQEKNSTFTLLLEQQDRPTQPLLLSPI